jgi:hypothetical protein
VNVVPELARQVVFEVVPDLVDDGGNIPVQPGWKIESLSQAEYSAAKGEWPQNISSEPLVSRYQPLVVCRTPLANRSISWRIYVVLTDYPMR